MALLACEGVPENDANAVKRYRKAAEQGDAAAQYKLGVMYAKGEGVPENDAEAVRWFRKGAEQGNSACQYELGSMYDTGEGVPQDYEEATLRAGAYPKTTSRPTSGLTWPLHELL